MEETLKIALDLNAAYDEQYTDELTAWRELGATYKAQNILAVCRGLSFARLLECGAGEGSILQHLDRAGFCPEMHALEISSSGSRAIQRRVIPSLRSVLRFNGYSLPYQERAPV